MIRIAALIWLAGAVPVLADATLASRYIWSEQVEGFGGFSGLELSADGVNFTAISDQSRVVQGQLLRDAKLRIVGVAVSGWDWLTDPARKRLDRNSRDAEGLAQRADGRLFVSFEGSTPRIWTYRGLGSEAAWLPRPDAFARLQANSGLEGLAIDADGALYTLPERSGRMDRPFPLWRYKSGAWDQPYAIPRRGDFLPVGLDFGPDGKLYLLERDFSGLSFATRIRRFTLTRAGLQNEQTVLSPARGSHTNLEGLAIWRDQSGTLRATMIADNNFRGFLPTELVEYTLPD